MISLYFFFFQEEDGIRDLTVTGVQSCALPIYERRPRAAARLPRPDVVRLGAPQGRRDGRPLPIEAVTLPARGGVDRGARRRVGRECGPLLEPIARGRRRDRKGGRPGTEARHQVPHLRAGRG